MTPERFMSKVSPEPTTGCWLWTGALAGNGYPMVWAHGRVRLATRVSYEIHRAPLPGTAKVLHRCDNPPCVNPAHLFAGTQLDNIRDMDRKGRRRTVAVRGEAQGLAKLDETAVRSIRRLLAKGETHRAIAERHGIERSTVTQIARGKTWQHVKGE